MSDPGQWPELSNLVACSAELPGGRPKIELSRGGASAVGWSNVVGESAGQALSRLGCRHGDRARRRDTQPTDPPMLWPSSPSLSLSLSLACWLGSCTLCMPLLPSRLWVLQLGESSFRTPSAWA